MSPIFSKPRPFLVPPRRAPRRAAAICALGAALALAGAAPPARAASPSAPAEPDPLDVYFDLAAGEAGARDAELGALTVGVEAVAHVTSQGASSFGAFAFVHVPFDRVAKPHRALTGSPFSEGPRSGPSEGGAPVKGGAPARDEPAGRREASAPASLESAPRPVLVSPELARGAVRAACHSAKLDDGDARLDALASRAKTSALLPELRLRVTRAIDESESVSPTEYDPLRRTASGGTSTWLEARATFRLDRLVFADDEIAVERLRAARAAERSRLVAKMLDLLETWQRARTAEGDPAAKPDAQVRATLTAASSAAALDVLTNGWFSKALASERAARSGGEGAESGRGEGAAPAKGKGAEPAASASDQRSEAPREGSRDAPRDAPRDATASSSARGTFARE